jgi:NADH-quinone oxidoreductase subunit L
LPYTFWSYAVTVLAISGTPLTAAFFSKDEILWQAFSGPYGSPFLWLLGVAGAGLTAFYMFRQLFLVFFGEPRADDEAMTHVHESPKVMVYPVAVLALGAVAAGWIGLPAYLGTNLFAEWLEPVFGRHVEEASSPALEISLTSVSVAAAALGFYLAYLLYYHRSLDPERFASYAGGLPYRLSFQKYYVDEMYNVLFVRSTLVLSRLGAWIDQYIIDFIVDGSARMTAFISRVEGLFDNYVVDWIVNKVGDLTFGAGDRFRKFQTGNINSYLYVILATVLILMVIKLRYSP